MIISVSPGLKQIRNVCFELRAVKEQRQGS
uniref:Uncharacterized protein n=1 Tax=Anguilla anguilla TaxID=7936 RepID=A0A0E9QPQ1_ANGAN